ncbi:hypothetical protein CHM34_06490 [Paludifilum halophilum]|uniref:ABC transporter permease n=1 Tax=Paludifilum halophilum TaxID=1642702 RepID=A0A235B833_9BACL|nr:hypothetical protein CHM34_06490 [Paludifilum halophilum]
MFVFPYEGYNGILPENPFRLRVGGESVTVPIEERKNIRVFNEHSLTAQVVVVHDERFREWYDTYGERAGTVIRGWVLPDWRESGPAVKQMRRELKGGDEQAMPDTPVEGMTTLHRIFTPILFISLLIGALLFLAAGSMLYFQVFAELSRDRKQFFVLKNLGITSREWERLVTWRIRILFFIPLLIAFFLALALLSMVEGISGVSMKGHLPVVFTGYTLLYAAYYRMTKQAYI